MIRRILLPMAISACLFTACDENGKDEFEVKGTITGAPVTNVFLQEIPMNGMPPTMIDSAKVVDGKFSLNGLGKEESLYQIAFESSPGVLIINDEEEIDVAIDMSKKKDFYTIKGSPASESLRKFIFDYTSRQEEMQTAYMQMDSLQKAGASDSTMMALSMKQSAGMEGFNKQLEDYLAKEKSPAAAIFAVGMSARTMEPEKLKAVLNEVSKKFPDHTGVKSVKETFEQQLAAFEKQQQEMKNNSLVGKSVPELTLPDVNGKQVSISDFKGKYVLVDFWASWCGPCREENPNVVAAFNKYKNKNFTILGVSLDKEKSKWLEAIKEDQLNWAHVSDLAFWDSKAVQTFKFNGIPFNILVDPSGKIIADNLRGAELDAKLAEELAD